jgi:hypothetical protein
MHTATLTNATKLQVLSWLEQIETLGMSVRASALKAQREFRDGNEDAIGRMLGQSAELNRLSAAIARAIQ